MKGRSHLLKYLIAIILAAIFPLLYMTRQSFGPSAQASQRHPLDPLSRDEVTATVTVLKDAGKLAPETRFASIYLKEPPKEQVVADVTAGRARRAAYALLYNWTTRVTSEAVVELGQRELVFWKDWEPSDPPARSVIINRLQEIVKADARWQQAARRGWIQTEIPAVHKQLHSEEPAPYARNRTILDTATVPSNGTRRSCRSRDIPG